MITLALTAWLAACAGCALGFSLARSIRRPAAATHADDDAAFLADERQRYDQLIASLDIPQDRSTE